MPAIPLRIGLTGSIGMGKSTIADQCRLLGLPVFCADDAAHELLASAEVVSAIAEKFPTAMHDGKVNRKELGSIVFKNASYKGWLEALLHPKIREKEEQIFHSARVRAAGALVCDIPLLFETGGQDRMDVVMVVDAPAWMQWQRVMRRSNMTEEKLEQIRASQWPQDIKCALADVVIPTSLGKKHSLHMLRAYLKSLGLCVK